MASTSFVTGTTITSIWLNDVNSVVWGIFNGATTVAQALTALGITGLTVPVTVATGGTGLTTGTSGGILGFTGTTTLASSVLLTANALILGAGAGATPTPLGSLGTTTTVLHGNAAGAPSFASVTPNDFGTQTANTLLAGPTTGSAATPTFRAIVAADLPVISGTILQEVVANDAGTSTSSTSFVNLNAGNISIVPKNAASNLLVDVQFYGSQGLVASTNVTATFQLYDVTNATLVGNPNVLMSTSGGGGTATSAPCNIRAIVANAVTTSRTFQLQGKVSSASETGSATVMVWSIREIKT